jgi:hypothetical protein
MNSNGVVSCFHPLMMTRTMEHLPLRKSSILSGTQERLSVATQSLNLSNDITSTRDVWASTNLNDKVKVGIS